ncbi:alginate O-acetyltransferase AlgX-related protein [Phenylobacterium sp.]|uniref:alginate O-acetyltransferase AlgX-related protein n=1 Tax=Phenylobacterium sp. TaxID=1871053 RepID=UPI002EDACC64
MARDLRRHWAGLIAATLAVIALGVVPQPWIDPPMLEENRVLAKAPPLALARADFAGFRKAVDNWVADQFPARPYLISTLNLARLKVGATGSSRVIAGRDGWLFYDDGSALGVARGDPAPTRDEKQAWLQGLAVRTEAARQNGAAFVTLIAPLKETVYPQFGPSWYDGPDRDRASVTLSRLAAASAAGEVVYPHAAIARDARWGLKVYSRHDTHWTGLGAYVAYAGLMNRLQAMGVAEGPRPITAFTEDRAGSPYKPRDLALMLGVASFVHVDYPELVDRDAEDRLKVTYLTPRTDWTAPQVIDTGSTGKPVLLFVRDSFSNAVMPYLYGHFSRIIATHAKDGAFRRDLMARFKPDVVVLEVAENSLVHIGVEPGRPPVEVTARIAQAIARDTPPPAARVNTAGTAGADRLQGGPDGEVIAARGGDDVVDGGGGGDTIRGGRGADRVLGGRGADWLSGDRDDDIVTGGPGADVFHSSADAGLDEITDFSAAEGDRVQLDAGTRRTIRQEGPDVVVQMAQGRVVLRGVNLTDLPPGWINAE